MYCRASVSACAARAVRRSPRCGIANRRRLGASLLTSRRFLPGRLLGCPNEILRRGRPLVLSCAVEEPAVQHPAIQGQIIARHALGRELLLEPFADRAPIELTGEWHRSGCLSDVLDY